MSDLKRLFVCLHEYRRDLILGMVLVLVETFFELVIPVLMADLIDVGVANRDVHYILIKGGQMGVCAVLALVAGPTAGAPTSARRSSAACRAMPFQTSTTSRPPASSPA